MESNTLIFFKNISFGIVVLEAVFFSVCEGMLLQHNHILPLSSGKACNWLNSPFSRCFGQL
jgi:hypothetical protein